MQAGLWAVMGRKVNPHMPRDCPLSLNGRMAEAGRDLCRPSGPDLLLKVAHVYILSFQPGLKMTPSSISSEKYFS